MKIDERYYVDEIDGKIVTIDTKRNKVLPTDKKGRIPLQIKGKRALRSMAKYIKLYKRYISLEDMYVITALPVINIFKESNRQLFLFQSQGYDEYKSYNGSLLVEITNDYKMFNLTEKLNKHGSFKINGKMVNLNTELRRYNRPSLDEYKEFHKDYYVNKNGTVYSKRSERVLRPQKDKWSNRYVYINDFDNPHIRISHMVYTMFIGEYDNDEKYIDYKDGNKMNFSANNLYLRYKITSFNVFKDEITKTDDEIYNELLEKNAKYYIDGKLEYYIKKRPLDNPYHWCLYNFTWYGKLRHNLSAVSNEQYIKTITKRLEEENRSK